MRWIIGDIHGMLRPLEQLLAAVSRIDAQARLYFVGDYVNRGPDAKGVIDLLLSLDGARFVRGNHDDIFDQIVNDTSYASNASNGDRYVAYQWFMDHGLDQTFASYGVDCAIIEACARRPNADRLRKVTDAVPESHRQFVRRLPATIEEADLFVVHAKWDPDEFDDPGTLEGRVAAQSQARHKLLWGRYSDAEIFRVKAWKRTGYFGHTPVYAYAASQTRGEDVMMVPIAGNKMVLVDTGAALSTAGRLTAFCADDRTFVQVDHFGRVVESGE